MKPHTHVIGLGNPVAGDDAIGLCLVKDLQTQFSLYPVIKISACYQTGLYLLDFLVGFERVILIDSIVNEKRPVGDIITVTLPEEPSPPIGVSPHFIGIQSVISLGKLHRLQMPEELLILGIVIHNDQQLQESLSAELKSRYPDILTKIVSRIDQTVEQTLPPCNSSSFPS